MKKYMSVFGILAIVTMGAYAEDVVPETELDTVIEELVAEPAEDIIVEKTVPEPEVNMVVEEVVPESEVTAVEEVVPEPEVVESGNIRCSANHAASRSACCPAEISRRWSSPGSSPAILS